MANKKTVSQAAAADPLRPTSDLPFAVRVCDVPHLDEINCWRFKVAEQLTEHKEGQFERTVRFAQDMAQFADRVSKLDDLLASAEDCLRRAQRGEVESGAGAMMIFMRGCSLIGFARELMESAVNNADESMEKFCIPKKDAS
jgi:hypothetical protein